MKKRTFRIAVTQWVEVTLDADAFDEAFMSEFRESFFNFDTLEEHAEHIAQMQARGVINVEITPEFIEGYGLSQDMGIKARVYDTEIDLVTP